jgi:hypothetical protein
MQGRAAVPSSVGQPPAFAGLAPLPRQGRGETLQSMKREPLSYVECSLPRTNMTLAEYRRARRPEPKPRHRLRRMALVALPGARA